MKQAKAELEDGGVKPSQAGDDDRYDFDPHGSDDEWCEHCQNTGELDCHCGGDLCVCENGGTYPCPHCNI